MEACQNLDSLAPKLVGDRLIRRNHTLLNHLMRFIVRTRLNAHHFALVIEFHLNLWNFQIESPIAKARAPQLLGERMDIENDAALTLTYARVTTRNHIHHLLIGIARLRTDN